MSAKQEQICRLCLKATRNECKDVDKTVKLMFDILLLKLDLNITRNPIVCQNCVEVAKKCVDFKYTCVRTERVILSFSIGMKEAKHDIKVICQKGEDAVALIVDEDFNICRFCMTRLERNHFISLDILMNDTIFKMLLGYLPEMDLNIIENPTICSTCTEKVDGYFQFVRNYLNIEEKIKAHRKDQRNGNMNRIKLSNVQNFKDILEDPDKFPQTCIIKQESDMFEDGQYVYPVAHSELIKLEELDIKGEQTNLNGKSYKNLSEKILDKCDDLFPSKKYDKDRVQANVVDISGKSTSNIQKCMFNYSGVSEKRMHKCSLCAYKAQGKGSLKIHMLLHKNVPRVKTHKCSLCAYEAKRKGSLKIHMLVHKNVPNVKMHKCSLCAYEAKRKSNLDTHMLRHKDETEIQMYKCSSCPYESKQKYLLKLHTLVHLSNSETQMYRCPLCVYETKHKGYLNTHILVHKDVSEVRMYKCSLCPYEAKYRGSLIKHTVVHRDVSETKTYKCSLCSYEAKYKCNLATHMLVHKDISDIKMYKCSLCVFETKHRRSLSKHMLVHKNTSEINMYKCSLCPYESKRKDHLKLHMVVHQNDLKIKMYKCSSCAFESKHKSCLRKHMLVHKDTK